MSELLGGVARETHALACSFSLQFSRPLAFRLQAVAKREEDTLCLIAEREINTRGTSGTHLSIGAVWAIVVSALLGRFIFGALQ